ncbi:MAG: hypothetical protein V1895_00520 [Parcubacteria group bacterium]
MLSERATSQRLRELLERPAANPLLVLARRPGVEVYVVGGAVRDALLGVTVTDLDLVVRGLPQPQLERILRRAGRVVLAGKRFGVIKFRARGASESIDVALPRSEQPTGRGGYRDVHVVADHLLPIEQDLARRDFTINAIALNLQSGRQSGRLVDPFGGRADLKAKLIRTVGDPAKRFSEDYTRLLRAVRFAVQFGFGLERQTLQVLQQHAADLPRTTAYPYPQGERLVAWELIGREVGRMFFANAARAVDLLEQTKLLHEVLPEVDRLRTIKQDPKFHPEGDVLTHTKQALLRLHQVEPGASLTLILSVLLHDAGKATHVQIRDRKLGTTVNLSRPAEFFASERYQPARQRIMNIGHPAESARIAQRIIKRLKLTQFRRDPQIGLDQMAILHNLENHLLLDIENVRPARAEKILFYPDGRVRWDLLTLIKLDAGPGSDRPAKVFARVQKLLARKLDQAAEQQLPAPLLTGHDLKKMKVEPGPIYKVVLEAVRDAQLAGRVTDQAAARRVAKDLLARLR